MSLADGLNSNKYMEVAEYLGYVTFYSLSDFGILRYVAFIIFTASKRLFK